MTFADITGYRSPTGWLALFDDKTTFPVECWGNDGHPWIVLDSKLVRPYQRGGFVRLIEAPHVIAVVPAQPGWYVRNENDENLGDRYEIAAWMVVEDGDVAARPIAAAKGNWIPLSDEHAVVYPPNGWPTNEDRRNRTDP